MTTLYDPECQDLAEHFLQHRPYTRATAAIFEVEIRSLAEAIQEAVEAWFVDHPSDDD